MKGLSGVTRSVKWRKVKLEPRKWGCRAGYERLSIPAHISPPNPQLKKKKKKATHDDVHNRARGRPPSSRPAPGAP